MKYCAIIAEFNPLTNGHAYIINTAKQKTGLDCLCIMSGNFVQRGELACLEKHERAKLALMAGASAVFELPTLFAISGAPYFAEGAVKCLSKLNCVSHIAFGIELSNHDELIRLAWFKVKESQTIKSAIDQNMKNGDNYSVASFKAYTNNAEGVGFSEGFINEVFNSPNNILALEYLTAIYKLNAPITPVFIQRLDNGYNSDNVKTVKIDGEKIDFAGASHIRNCIENKDYKKIKKLVPAYSYESIMNINENQQSAKEERLNALILENIRFKTAKELENYYDYNQGLASLIYKNVCQHSSIDKVVEACTSKTYRKSRIKKLLLYPLLGITKTKAEKLKEPIALNVLAVKSSHKDSLSKIIAESNIKLIISYKDYTSLQNKTSIDINQKGSNIYNICNSQPQTQDLCVFVD